MTKTIERSPCSECGEYHDLQLVWEHHASKELARVERKIDRLIGLAERFRAALAKIASHPATTYNDNVSSYSNGIADGHRAAAAIARAALGNNQTEEMK
jgi:hypothetical protein